MCDQCTRYELASADEKLGIQEKYEKHIKEIKLCREEKRSDRCNINETNICAVYDLEAAMTCPKGAVSSFYYRSRLNCYNFTIVELAHKSKDTQKSDSELGAYKEVYCYFWNETQGNKGAIEIGSCVFDYLKSISENNADRTLNIIFYSDNCNGQNKNKYIASLYSYAVAHFDNIQSITHKYLIKTYTEHTQNEGDNAHSLIEKEIKRNLRSGPIYIPQQYVPLLRGARKTGTPFREKELDYNLL